MYLELWIHFLFTVWHIRMHLQTKLYIPWTKEHYFTCTLFKGFSPSPTFFQNGNGVHIKGHSLSTNPLIDIYVVSMFWLVINAAVVIGYRYLFKTVTLLSLDIFPDVGFLDHRIVLFLIFWGSSALFSIGAASIYNPTNSAQGSSTT